MPLRVSTVLICLEDAYIHIYIYVHIYMHAYIHSGVEVNTLLLIVILLVAWFYSANSSHSLV